MSDVSMPMIARVNAAKHLVKTSKRNRLPLPINQRHWVCRECTQLLIPGENSRVRIRNGQRIITCLTCGKVRRFGGGQNHIGVLEMSEIPSAIKKQAMDRNFQPSVRIGKTGITENIVDEIRGQLAKRKLVKIKINKGIYDREDRSQVWDYLSQETSSVVVMARGNVGFVV